MDNLTIKSTDRSPEINFDFNSNVFNISGESYPEDVNEFYSSILEKLSSHFDELKNADIEFNFELIYFNSSSAKIFMELFDMLEETADEGNNVTVNWIYAEDDDHMEELGEEFGEDLEKATFNMKAK